MMRRSETIGGGSRLMLSFPAHLAPGDASCPDPKGLEHGVACATGNCTRLGANGRSLWDGDLVGAAAMAEEGSFSVGRVFARGAGAVSANLLIVLPIAFLCGALLNNGIARLINPLAFPLVMSLGYTMGPLIFWPISIASGAFIGVVTQGAMTHVVAMHASGGRPTLGAALMSGLTVLFPLLLLGILMAIATVIGTLLLIVPGVIVLVMWSVAASALVEERGGILDALYRSLHLTKGARWRVLGVELVLIVLGLIATALLTTISLTMFRIPGPVTNGVVLLRLVPTLAIHTALYAFVPAVKAALYVELREWKEGPQTHTLAEVFA